ncbi:xylulokinase [Ruminococcaceae bacterium OttesenSCG-928-L11]|nr:xylulokinase [Ruminococcaceae bacterium OttesenSCG-928-L11]
MKSYLLGIDVGTSACKAALFDEDGAVKAGSGADYPVLYPQPGWAEQSPDDWWNAVCKAIRQLLEQEEVSPGQIAGVGIAGQSWSAIPVDSAGKALCNTPIWMDTRAQAICNRLGEEIGEDAIFPVCGNPLQPTYTLPKVLWYREHRPELYRQADKILQSNGYIAYRLTGAVSQDLSQGYGYHCFDMRTGRWDESLCRAMGLRRDLLPDIVDCSQIIGTVTAEAAGLCGLAEGTPVVAGGLDAACGALGVGVLADGETQEQGGQAGGMSICTETYRADPRLILSHHVAPGRWLLQGGTVGGGGILRWFEREFCDRERAIAVRQGTGSFAEMDRLAADVPVGSDGVVFLPYMAGERSPIWNPHAKGVYYGLDYTKTRAHLLRASMEGAAFALRHNLLAAQEAGAGVERLRAMGGAANSRLWTQMKSDVTGKPVDVPASDHATTLGAAILAGVAVGMYPDFHSAVSKTVRLRRSHQPNPATRDTYDAGFQTYLALYEQLKPLMK